MRGAVIVTLLAVAACAACTESRPYPYWRAASDAPAVAACADIRARVVRTGKEGIGVVISLAGTQSEPCEISVDAVQLSVHRAVTARGEVPALLARLRMTRGTTVRGYVPIPFDFNAAYNAGARDATLHVDAGGRRLEVALVLEGAR